MGRGDGMELRIEWVFTTAHIEENGWLGDTTDNFRQDRK